MRLIKFFKNIIIGRPLRNFRKRSARISVGFIIDSFTQVKSKRVVFVSKQNVQVMGNLRVMLDALIREGGYEIGVFKKGEINDHFAKDMLEKGVRLMTDFDLSTLRYIYSSQVVVVSHSARDAFISRPKKARRVINVWHGVAIKKIEALMTSFNDPSFSSRKKQIHRNSKIYDTLIASSKVDQLVITASFGVDYSKVLAAGLPRYDYFNIGYKWPDDLLQNKQDLAAMLAGRKFVLYAPTFRDDGNGLGDLINKESIHFIRSFCEAKNIAFGIRPHPYNGYDSHTICDNKFIIDLSAERYPEAACLLTLADAVIADYSSIWVDYLFRGLPIIGFMPDRKAYSSKDRGFIYELEQLFPGNIYSDWVDVLHNLSEVLTEGISASNRSKMIFTKSLLISNVKNDVLFSDIYLDLFKD